MNTAPSEIYVTYQIAGMIKSGIIMSRWQSIRWMIQKSAKKRKMTRLLMNAIDDYNAGKVAPDTIGADYFFLDQFMTYEMEYDFVAIEMDFLEHCRERLDELTKLDGMVMNEHINYGPGFQ